MDPRRVLVFRTVARAGSLSAAARELGWTQPAVSQQLQRLEHEVGGPLVLRSTRGVTLTDAGRLLLGRADALAGELHMAGEELAALAQLRGGRVRLVSYPSAVATIVPEALRLFRAGHPAVDVSLAEAEPPEAATAVREGTADLALVFAYDGAPADDGALTWLPLTREPVELVLPPDHPAASRSRLSLASLADDTWIAGCPRCSQHLVERCREAGFEPRVTHATDDYVAVQALVAAGLGVTMLPQSALTAFRHPEVVVRSSRTLGSRHVGLAYRPGAEQVPATAALMEQLIRTTARR
ncbi:LysR family transcriptional regulator [Nocardioides euryhalodurans]|uniref:LysR family transcriptional regulator n=1 Tax=Nocardioides euryhalodurans TaxID=2518370 RepID=A0A4P7GLW7_9ACTN|nr:LysR family transcriptional regulator [Nocardioides euryhalodurans]QBR92983.1 LysR family transcriptional regulator [Nocardioides euryhalodurans]